MLNLETNKESFKDLISKKLERHEDNFKNLADKIKTIEVMLNEQKMRLKSLEDDKKRGDNSSIELQHVNKT